MDDHGRGLGRSPDAHRSGDRPRHRQHHFHRDCGGEVARRSARARAANGSVSRDVHPYRAAAVDCVVMSLTRPLMTLFGVELSGRSMILAGGGLFLIFKSTREIHDNLEGDAPAQTARRAASFAGVIVQILLLDIVFSLDSVITAVGMAEFVSIMIAAIIIAVFAMLFASTTIAEFVERHPTVKMLALAFLLLIGLSLILEGLGQHVPKGYIYFAMGFSVFVEMINLRMRSKVNAVHLRRNLPDQ